VQVIRCLLIVPFPESSLNDEAAKLFMESYDEYARRARVWTSVHALANDRKMPAAAASSSSSSLTVTPGGPATTGEREEQGGGSGGSPVAASQVGQGDIGLLFAVVLSVCVILLELRGTRTLSCLAVCCVIPLLGWLCATIERCNAFTDGGDNRVRQGSTSKLSQPRDRSKESRKKGLKRL
jgi:hypothetical protein